MINDKISNPEFYSSDSETGQRVYCVHTKNYSIIVIIATIKVKFNLVNRTRFVKHFIWCNGLRIKVRIQYFSFMNLKKDSRSLQ